MWLALILGVSFAACGDDTNQTVNITGPEGFGSVASVTITSGDVIDLHIGNLPACQGQTYQLVASVMPSTASQVLIWYSSDNRVVNVSPSGLVTAMGVGVATISATSAVNSGMFATVKVVVTSPISCNTPPPPPPAGCPTGFGFIGNCATPTWSPLQPADTTIIAATRYAPTGYVFIPAGFSTSILVSTRGCVAYFTPKLITTGTQSVYVMVDTLQGVATCRDSVVYTVSGTSAQAFVHVSVVSLTPPGVTIAPKTVPNGPVGGGGQHTCTVVGLTDLRCWFYSTDPSRVAVVQKDTTFAGPTNPWPTLSPNFHKGGEWKNIWTGTANICTFAAVDPRIIDCAVHTVTASGSIQADVQAELIPLGDHPITVELDLIHKMIPKGR